MQFRAFEPGIEVLGRNVAAYLAGFKTFTTVPSTFMVKEKIGQLGTEGVIDVPPDAWVPLDAWLRVNEQIHKAIGAKILFDVGRHVVSTAVFPPSVVDIRSGLRSIDVAYHMNHRRRGEVMFDPASSRMLEGIGHYGYEERPGKNEVISVCHNPYSCTFDHGIITAMAQRFEPQAKVVHRADAPCREKGADSCTYLITW